MEATKDASGLFKVEKRTYHASRPGFRIAEFTINPTQGVPWHYHSKVQDTFYVLKDKSVFHCATPKKRCASHQAKHFQYGRSDRTLLPTTVGPEQLS
jgi:hypothetical protein